MNENRVVSSTRVDKEPRMRIAEIPYTRPGAITISQSPDVVPSNNFTVIGFSATLTTPGSSTTTVVLLRNGVEIARVDMAPGVIYHFVEVANIGMIARKDRYAIGVIAAGTGAQELSGSIETVG